MSDREYEEGDHDTDGAAEALSDTHGGETEQEEEDTGDPEGDDGAEEPNDTDDTVDPEGETEDASEPEAAPVTPEEEAEAVRVLAVLRAADGPLTVDKLHPEVNVEGSEGYVPAGRIERVLGLLASRGLVDRTDGEAWSPVAPGVLALRRGELLAALANFTIEDEEWADAQRAFEGGWTSVQKADAAALIAAGVLKLEESFGVPVELGEQNGDDKPLHVVDSAAASAILTRGAVAAVLEAMPDCRAPSAPVLVTDGDTAELIARERALRQLAESQHEGACKQLTAIHKAKDALQKQNGIMRAWFRENNLPCPTEAAVQPAPPRDEFTHPVRVTWEVRGRMALLRKGLGSRLAEADGVLSLAKANHKAKAELLGTQIKTIDDQLEGMFFDVQVFRRVDVERGVAELVCVDDEGWVLEEKPLRSEQAKPKASPAAAEPEPAAPAAAPEQPAQAPAGGPMTVLAADDAGGAAPAGDAKEAPREAQAPAPVIQEPVSDKPKAPALTKENLALLLGELADGMHPDDEMTLAVATEKVAAKLGVEAGTALGQLVKVAARRAFEAGKLRWWAAAGNEWIARQLKKTPPPLTEPTEAVLAAVSGAGAAGVRKVDLIAATHLEEKVVDDALATLRERSAITTTGRARGTRYVAAEHAGSASAEASV